MTPPGPGAIADAHLYRPGVGLVLFNRDGRVFIGQRGDVPGNHWQLPQGGIDEGETPREAALRELHEEVGTDKAEIVDEIEGWLSYDLPPEFARQAWGGRYRGQRQRWFALRLLGTDRDIDIAKHKGHQEFVAWRWERLDRLPGLIIPFKRGMYEKIVARFHRLAGH